MTSGKYDAVNITHLFTTEYDSIYSRSSRHEGVVRVGVALELAEQRTEAMLISSRAKFERIRLRVGNHTIVIPPALKYFRVMVDNRQALDLIYNMLPISQPEPRRFWQE